MKITLEKSHRFFSYVGKKPVVVWKTDCENYECFSPHNWQFRRADGVVVASFRCNNKEHYGCPENPKTRKGEKPKRKKLVLLDDINTVLDRLICEAGEWEKREGMVGDTDKESWFKCAAMQARKIKAIINNEIEVCPEKTIKRKG